MCIIFVYICVQVCVSVLCCLALVGLVRFWFCWFSGAFPTLPIPSLWLWNRHFDLASVPHTMTMPTLSVVEGWGNFYRHSYRVNDEIEVSFIASLFLFLLRLVCFFIFTLVYLYVGLYQSTHIPSDIYRLIFMYYTKLKVRAISEGGDGSWTPMKSWIWSEKETMLE